MKAPDARSCRQLPEWLSRCASSRVGFAPTQLLLRLLARIDIGQQVVPADDAAVGVSKRVRQSDADRSQVVYLKTERCPSGCPPSRRSASALPRYGGQVAATARHLAVARAQFQRRAEADEGARLENESGELHRVLLTHLFAQSIQRLPAMDSFSM